MSTETSSTQNSTRRPTFNRSLLGLNNKPIHTFFSIVYISRVVNANLLRIKVNVNFEFSYDKIKPAASAIMNADYCLTSEKCLLF